MSPPASLLALARHIDDRAAKQLERELGEGPGRDIGVLLAVAYPALMPVHGWQVDALDRMGRDGWRSVKDRDVFVSRLLRAVGDVSDHELVVRGLRREMWVQKARIALRELLPQNLGGVDILVSARELSELAEAAFDVALVEATSHAARRFGEPRRPDGDRSTLVVFGMGKLGGYELNAGSDVDVILFYDTDEGGSDVTLHEHWTYVARRTVQTVEAPTEDGMVWRVDLRLRPEGSKGPLVYSWAAAERYYETWGRLWERAALLRARPIAGDHELGEAFYDEVVIPFVFRRKVDPTVATGLAELVQTSRRELCADPVRDLKLGPGGIREAEFFIQSLQLIWGGREPSLRVPGSIAALERLSGQGLVTDREARTIIDSYLLLRRAEHAVQWASGTQTHLLPKEEDARERLARVLGFSGERALSDALSAARGAVGELFASLLPETPRPPARHTRLLAQLAEPGEALNQIVFETFADVEVAEHLAALARRPDGLLGQVTLDRFPELGDALLDALADCSDPEQASRYLRSFFGRFLSPSPYIRSMARDSRIVGRMVTVLGASVFVGDALVARPDLADVLIFSHTPISVSRARRLVRLEVEELDNRTNAADVHEKREQFIGALRRAKGKAIVEVAVADLAGELSMRDVTLVLSELADEVVDQTVAFEMGGDATGLAVIAVGKLGGMDIGYGSDLDVLFIYDPARAPDGEDPAEFFTRRAQRVIRSITSPHQAGAGYELDTRLRPSGSQGLLVTSLASFARYHRVPFKGSTGQSERPRVLSSGAAWERQALLRARPCAGDRALGQKMLEIAHVAAYERGAPPAEEIHHLRMRMERELAHEKPGRYDIKTGKGGLLDIEFAVQWLQMRYGADPRVRTPDTLEALHALRSGGHLPGETFELFRDAYHFLRRLEQRIRVVHSSGAPIIDEGAPGLDKLARRMGLQRTPYAGEAELLLEQYRDVTARTRQEYLEVLGVSAGRGQGAEAR